MKRALISVDDVVAPASSSVMVSSHNARMLVIAPNWIGDAIMAQPLLQLLKQNYPHRAIDVLAPSWVAPVIRAMSEVDHVIESSLKHGSFKFREYLSYAQILRHRSYSEVYVLPNTLKYALLPWLAGIKKRIGYRGETRYGLINVMHHDNRHAPLPMTKFYAALAAKPKTQFALVLPRPVLHVAPAQIETVYTSLGLSGSSKLIVFAPGAEFGTAKRWPASHFARLAQTIKQAHPQAQVVLLGSPKDVAVCEEILSLSPKLINLAGKTSLDQAIAVIAGAALMVSNDSGLLHVASGLNRPVIALYGPTDPEHAPPFSDVAKSVSLHLACAPCKQRECPLGHQDCMQKISSEHVWTLLQPMLDA
ncbi:lipopolysaccharide heptosyltransferase II [Undibacterium sp.]|uniref:lipopolysaccharide heptosyltransferase II n=1 Tax=Undibacterium sp. TaxID=1914977 RepID=UPI0025D054AE|nr:lipopolysaccharide heptosyltransferase II [Undibacterium sp.]